MSAGNKRRLLRNFVPSRRQHKGDDKVHTPACDLEAPPTTEGGNVPAAEGRGGDQL